MIKPLTIGSYTFDNNLIQGPLAGVSCAPFRYLTWALSKPAFSCTEMISCNTLLYQTRNNHRFTYIHPQEGPVCFQLSSTSAKDLGEAVKKVTDLGATLIDLNCGCPVNKIRSRGAGSKLLSTPAHLFSLIQAMKQNTHLPISVKIRVDGQSEDRNNELIAQVVADAGADCLVVHGRNWRDGYDRSPFYDQIAFFVEALTIPVIGNGDISCLNSLKKMLDTGCAGAMIARAGVGRPWLIAELKAALAQKPFAPPPTAEIGKMFMRHIEELATLLNSESFAVIQARKVAKYYARNLDRKVEFCSEINECNQLDTFMALCEQYFKG